MPATLIDPYEHDWFCLDGRRYVSPIFYKKWLVIVRYNASGCTDTYRWFHSWFFHSQLPYIVLYHWVIHTCDLLKRRGGDLRFDGVCSPNCIFIEIPPKFAWEIASCLNNYYQCTVSCQFGPCVWRVFSVFVPFPSLWCRYVN